MEEKMRGYRMISTVAFLFFSSCANPNDAAPLSFSQIDENDKTSSQGDDVAAGKRDMKKAEGDCLHALGLPLEFGDLGFRKFDKEYLLENYADDAYSYESVHLLPSGSLGWAEWMIDEEGVFDEGYLRGRTNPTLTISVIYDNEIPYDPPWASEEEHLAALEEQLELAYAGWDITLNLDDPAAEVTAILGVEGGSYASPAANTVYLHYETILSHELAHLFGIQHHYLTVSGIGDCEWCPPGEGDCIMDRTSSSFGPAERFAFLLDDERYDDEIDENTSDILSRYPADW